MAKEVMLQVSMDSELKEQVELLYQRLGTSFAEAVRIFAKQSVADGAMPFALRPSLVGKKRVLGLANGKYEIPDNIDESNEEILKLFEGKS